MPDTRSVSSPPTIPPLRPLRDFRDRLPGHRANGRLHLSTIIRWACSGVRLPDGRRVRLRAIRVGSRWLSCDAWFDEFVAHLTTAHLPPAPVAEPVPPAATDRAEAAARELDRRGVVAGGARP